MIPLIVQVDVERRMGDTRHVGNGRQQPGEPDTQQRLFGRGVWLRRGHFHHLSRLVWAGHQRGQQIHAVFDVVVLGVYEDLDQIRVALRIGKRAKTGAQEERLGLDAGIAMLHGGPGALHQHG